MFKRMGALTAIPVVLGLAASLALAGTVTAKPSAGVTITRTEACHYTVWYYWTGMGHGNDLTAAISISAVDAGGSFGLEWVTATNKHGTDGVLNHDFVVHTGTNYAFQYMGSGELRIPSKSSVIAKSVAISGLSPQTPEVCF
jgi:hypothetical protein